jgi:hypothetical protein
MKKVRPLEVNGRTECVLGIGLLASAILCRGLRWLGASGQVTLLEIATVLMQPTAEDLNRWQEVVALRQHQINVIEILSAAKAVSEIVFRIHRRTQFPAARTLKAEVAVYLLRDRTVLTKSNNRQLHRQVVADRAQ